MTGESTRTAVFTVASTEAPYEGDRPAPFISAKTADQPIQHIYTELGVSNRVAVARWAIEQEITVAADP